MNLAELKDIDFSDVGSWPTPVKVIAIVVLSLAVLGLGGWFDTRPQVEKLTKVIAEELLLRADLERRQQQAANLDQYVQQMEEMRLSFETMSRQLPSENEVAELLEDISRTGLANGLEFELFRPGAEAPKAFFAELPITIKVAGDYHEFGNFASSVAALPRIVTLNNISITSSPVNQKDPRNIRLVMDATAQTYRYLENAEGAE